MLVPSVAQFLLHPRCYVSSKLYQIKSHLGLAQRWYRWLTPPRVVGPTRSVFINRSASLTTHLPYMNVNEGKLTCMPAVNCELPVHDCLQLGKLSADGTTARREASSSVLVVPSADTLNNSKCETRLKLIYLKTRHLIVCNGKVGYRVNNRPPSFPILSQINPIHALPIIFPGDPFQYHPFIP